jgi:hypothetical protein
LSDSAALKPDGISAWPPLGISEKLCPPVAAEQLCFFKFSKPLEERFGKHFFKSIPRVPGVYVFHGENNRALYVGHSRDLRQRLSYYKNAQPEREPRRIVRLVHQVREITLEPCETLDRAQVRELALIRQLQPKFNIANTLSRTFSFFALRERAGLLELRLRMSESALEDETIVGGFRNRGLCARAFVSLARSACLREKKVRSIYDLPMGLNHRLTHWSFKSPCRDHVFGLLSGEETSFFEEIATLVEETNDPFLRQLLEADFLVLAEFAQLAREMAELRSASDARILTQEALQVSSRLLRSRSAAQSGGMGERISPADVAVSIETSP